ncbi:MAG: hypothetical protein HY236_03200, partial [Acidobacteria bacterium]|nr:hypothetical protein [Acidobacteriota bacterium]
MRGKLSTLTVAVLWSVLGIGSAAATTRLASPAVEVPARSDEAIAR